MKTRRKNHKPQRTKPAVRHLNRLLDIDGQQWSWELRHGVKIRRPTGETTTVEEHKVLDMSYQTWFNYSQDRKYPGPAVTPGLVVRWIRMNMIPNPLNEQEANRSLKEALVKEGLRPRKKDRVYDYTYFRVGVTEDNWFELQKKTVYYDNWDTRVYASADKVAREVRSLLDREVTQIRAMVEALERYPQQLSTFRSAYYTEKNLHLLESYLT